MIDPSLLPTEIISLILDHVIGKDLQACAFVNKQFYAIAKPMLLWQTVKINGRTVFQCLDMLARIMTASPPVGHHIQNLHLEYPFPWTDDILLLLMVHVPHLEWLKLENASSITDASLEHLPRHCPRLRWLNIGESRISREFFLELGRHCLQLKTLTLGACTALLPPDAFLALGPTCPLEVLMLKLEGSDRYNDEYYGRGYRSLFDLTGLAHLTHLYINDASGPMVTRFFPSQFGHVRPLPVLTHLVLNGCDELVDHMLTPFLTSHPDLKSLEIVGGDLCDETLKTIANNIPNITHVSITTNRRFTRRGIHRLIRSCCLLTTVACTSSEIYDDDTLESYDDITEFDDDTTESDDDDDTMESEDDENLYSGYWDEKAVDDIRKRRIDVVSGHDTDDDDDDSEDDCYDDDDSEDGYYDDSEDDHYDDDSEDDDDDDDDE